MSYTSEAELGEFEEFGEYESEAEFGEFEGEYGGHGGAVSPLTEAEEIALASELLEISSEAELEQFLGGLINKVGGFFKSPVGQALGGIAKNIAKKALPVVGGALGTMVAPGIGTALGSSLGSMAGNMFEFGPMEAEQEEFEAAKRVVGLTAAAANRLAQTPPPPGMNPNAAARAAVLEAAQQYAPGLYHEMAQRRQQTAGRGRGQSGRGQSGRAQSGRGQSRRVGAGYPGTGQAGAAHPAARQAAARQAAPGQAAPGQAPAGHPAVSGAGGTQRSSAPGGRPSRGHPGYGPVYGPGYGGPVYGGPVYGGDASDFPYDGGQDDDADVDGDPSMVPDAPGYGRPTTGRWVRRGRRIVLFGI
jgi:hypothetical protein